MFFVEQYYNTTDLKLNENSEDALTDFINNPQILIIQGYMKQDNIYLQTRVSIYKIIKLLFQLFPCSINWFAFVLENSYNIYFLYNRGQRSRWQPPLVSFLNIINFQIKDDKNKSIVFYKTSAQELLHDDAVHNINILTLSSNTAETLYQIWRQVYTPLLAAVSILSCIQ